MEWQVVIINGKARRAYSRKGVLFVREAYDIELSELERFEKTLAYEGEKKSYIIKKFIHSFNKKLGLGDDNEKVRQQGSLFEARVIRRIEEAVKSVRQEVFQWNEN